MLKNENYSYGFYQELIQKMKNHKDALKGNDDAVNFKLWAVCDLAMGIITTRTTNFERKEFLSDARIPPMYFKPHEDPNYQNIQFYLPPELQHQQPKKAATPSIGSVMGPPMYTVSGQLANRNQGKIDVVGEPSNGSTAESDPAVPGPSKRGRPLRGTNPSLSDEEGQESKRRRE